MFPASGDVRFDKLPKWARDKIGVLERRNAELTKRLGDYEMPVTDETRIRLVNYTSIDTALPDLSTIRFQIGKHREECIEVCFDYSDTLRNGPPVGVSVRSGGRVYIEPQAANVFVAKPEMRASQVIPKGDA